MKLNCSLPLVISIISIPFVSITTLANTQIGDLENRRGMTITGEIQSVVGNDFVLNDGTGEVIVDAGPGWWHQLDLTTGESVSVVGEMDEGEFDAFSITRENGEVIDIREPQGPPPWAGGPNRNIDR
jgi:uncharacterized protein YdeI (BOF family)